MVGARRSLCVGAVLALALSAPAAFGQATPDAGAVEAVDAGSGWDAGDADTVPPTPEAAPPTPPAPPPRPADAGTPPASTAPAAPVVNDLRPPAPSPEFAPVAKAPPRPVTVRSPDARIGTRGLVLTGIGLALLGTGVYMSRDFLDGTNADVPAAGTIVAASSLPLLICGVYAMVQAGHVFEAYQAPAEARPRAPDQVTASPNAAARNYLPATIALGVGGAFLVGGAVTGVMALTRTSSLNDDCGGDRRCSPALKSEADAISTLGNVSTALFIGAAVSGGIAFFLWPRGDATAMARKTKTPAAPVHVGIHGLGLGVGGTF